jgi:hypothetical protein
VVETRTVVKVSEGANPVTNSKNDNETEDNDRQRQAFFRIANSRTLANASLR